MVKRDPESLTRADIEWIAGRIVTAYLKLPAVQKELEGVIQPGILIRELLCLSVEYRTLSWNGSILGLTSCAEVLVTVYDDSGHPEYFPLDGKTLLIDSGLAAEGANEGRIQFTLIHEACHQIYRMLFPWAYRDSIAERRVYFCTPHRSKGRRDWEEWRADTLTSAILMPPAMIRDNMAAFGLGEKLARLNRVFAPREYACFCEMAAHMGVSRQALAIRLKQLGLLEQDYLKDPYALVNVFPNDGERPG